MELQAIKEPVLFIMSGLPGSGKSTYARQYAKAYDAIVVSTDDLLEARAKEFGTSYDYEFQNNFNVVKAMMMENAKQAFKDRRNVVWDQTMLTVKSRRRALSMAPKEYHKVALVFQIDPIVLSERIDKRNAAAGDNGKFIPHGRIEAMSQIFVEPDFTENFDEIVWYENHPSLWVAISSHVKREDAYVS